MEDRFGGWSIDQKVFGWILSNLQVGSSILEMGSGWATGELARYYDMHSIEDSEPYLGIHRSHYIYAPTTDGTWYDRGILENELKRVRYQMLIIDGPAHHRRQHIIHHFDLFNWNVPVVIDDCQESDVMKIAKDIAENQCKRPYLIIDGMGAHGQDGKKAMVIA